MRSLVGTVKKVGVQNDCHVSSSGFWEVEVENTGGRLGLKGSMMNSVLDI